MKKKDLKNKKIALLGLGMETISLAKFFIKNRIEFTVCDKRGRAQLKERMRFLVKQEKWQLGKDFNKELYKFDIVFRSPGWPLFCPGIIEAQKHGAIIYSATKIFFDLCPAKIIGVTGTKGKGTTSSMIYTMLKAGGKKVYLGGNIGKALFDFIDKLKKSDWVVLELSSYQTEDLRVSPHITVMTNIFPEHLAPADPINPNYHKSFGAYLQAKLNLVRQQKKNDWLIVNNDNKKLKVAALKHGSGKKIFFSTDGSQVKGCYVKQGKIILKVSNKKQEVISIEKVRVPGDHNLSNICAASMAAYLAGVSINNIKKAIQNFKGLEHRLEFVRQTHGIKFYNDTFATTPEAATTAIKAFSAPKVMIIGGADKGVKYGQLARQLIKSNIRAVLLIGVTARKIYNEIRRADKKKRLEVHVLGKKKNMPSIVRQAYKLAQPGDMVILSPACASFDMFNNYKDRGEQFKEAVKAL